MRFASGVLGCLGRRPLVHGNRAVEIARSVEYLSEQRRRGGKARLQLQRASKWRTRFLAPLLSLERDAQSEVQQRVGGPRAEFALEPPLSPLVVAGAQLVPCRPGRS